MTPEEYGRSLDGRIAAVLPKAAREVPALARRLERAGVDPDELTSATALDRLPIQSKDELIDEQAKDPPFAGAVSVGARIRRVFQSPGPLYEPELDEADPWRWRPALEAAGFTADDIVLVAFSYHLTPAGAMFEEACRALGATVVPAGVGNKDLQARAIVDLGVTAYIGLPSYLKALLETLDAAGPGARGSRLVRAFVTAEPLPASLRDWLRARVPVVQQGYGTAETGNLGYESAAMDGLHVAADALVQVCDLTTGRARYDGGEGQVVATVLSEMAPVVRLGTGDLSAWATEPMEGDIPTPRLRGWLGRVGDAVKVRGMFLHPRQVASVMAEIHDAAAYRFVIDRDEHRDVLRCEVVPAGTADEGFADRVREAVRSGLRLDAVVTPVATLPDDAPAFDDVRRWE